MLRDAKYLTENEKKALAEIKRQVLSRYPGSSFVLFGSRARGDFARYSDIDVLVVTVDDLPWQDVDHIISVAYEVNLAYGTLFTCHTAAREAWENGDWTCQPLKESVEKDGIPV